ncbi:MAG: hypothetical protein ACOC16_03290 [Nanoarchaeota archaeon]
MTRKKKTQGSIELMILLAFMFVIIGFVMFITSHYFMEINQKKEDMQADSIAQNINKELAIMSKVEQGYYREFYLSKDNYNATLDTSLLILVNKQTNKTYYFDLIGNYNITLINKSPNNQNTYLVLQKPKLHINDESLS